MSTSYKYGDTIVTLSNNEREEFKRKVETIKTNIIDSNRLYFPFFISIELTDDISGFLFNGNSISINPAHVKELGLNEDEQAFFIGHEIAHAVYKHQDIYKNLQKLVNYNRKFLSIEKNVNLDTLFIRALNLGFEYEADVLGKQFVINAGYKDASVDALLKLGNLLDRLPTVLLNDYPLPQERAKKVLENGFVISQVDAEKRYQRLHFLIKENEECPSFYTSKMSVLEELEYANESRNNVMLVNNYLSWNGGFIKKLLENSSIRENRELYCSLVECREAYNKIIYDSNNVLRYGIVREQYKLLDQKLEKIEKETKELKNPFKRLSKKAKLLFNNGKENNEYGRTL